MSRIAEMTTSAVINREKGGQIKRDGKERTHGHKYLKRQSIYQNNLYNTNDTADLWLYGPQWKTKKIGFWMCTVPDGARWTRVEGIVQLIPTMKSIGADKQENKASKSNEAEKCDQIVTKEEKIDFSNVKIEPLFEEEVDFDTFSKSDFRAVKVKECVAVPKSKKLLQFTLDDGTGVDRTILSGIHAYYEPEDLVGKTLIAITNLPPRKMMGIESCGMLLSAVNNLKDSEDEELHLLMVDNHIPAGAKLY